MKLGKTLVIPLAGILLVGAAGAALATSGGAPAPGIGSVVPAAASPTPAPSTPAVGPAVGPVLTDVLDGLVAKGTITAAQETAILDALIARRTELQSERRAVRQQIIGFLSDGVITKAELDQLPADNPLRRLTSLMDDGKITLDELRALGRGVVKGLGGGMGGRGMSGGGIWGGGVWGGPDVSPAPGSGSGG